MKRNRLAAALLRIFLGLGLSFQRVQKSLVRRQIGLFEGAAVAVLLLVEGCEEPRVAHLPLRNHCLGCFGHRFRGFARFDAHGAGDSTSDRGLKF